MKKILGIALVVVMVVIAIGGYVYPKVQFGAATGPDHYDFQQFFGGFVRGNTYATTTGTAVTLKASDLIGWDSISIKPIVGAATLTFPASSTLTRLVPKAGMVQETCIHNASTTAAATITLAAGTGIDFETASSSPTDLTILADEFACLKFMRKAATASAFDIGVLITEYTNGD